MRIVILILGCLCGAIIVGMAALFGFRTSDSVLDGCIAAFSYGAIALGALLIVEAGIRLANQHGKPRVGTITIVIGLVVLFISLTNNIDATAERLNTTKARRTQTAQGVEDDRRDLERMQNERGSLKFERADWYSVAAARDKAEAAKKAKEAECKERGTRCRDREKDEVDALTAAEKAGRDYDASKRAAELDRDIPLLKEKIANAGPVLEASVHGRALASIFSLQGDASTRQFTLTNGGLELITFCLFVLYELMAPKEVSAHPSNVVSVPRRKRTYQRRATNGQGARQSAKIIQMPNSDPAEAIRLVQSGVPKKDVAAGYHVTVRTIDRWLERHRSEQESEIAS